MGRWKPLVGLGIAQFLMVLDTAVMNVSISQLVHDFHTEVTTIQAVSSGALAPAASTAEGRVSSSASPPPSVVETLRNSRRDGRNGFDMGLFGRSDGSVNSAGNPAASGSVIALFATGYGQTSPPGVTGKAAQTPYATPLMPVSLTIADVPADLLYQAEAPGFVGLLQVNARVPAIGTGRPRSVPIILKIGDQPSLSGVTISVL